jgi:hypothetical protein
MTRKRKLNVSIDNVRPPRILSRLLVAKWFASAEPAIPFTSLVFEQRRHYSDAERTAADGEHKAVDLEIQIAPKMAATTDETSTTTATAAGERLSDDDHLNDVFHYN